jgi:hypothetical protein
MVLIVNISIDSTPLSHEHLHLSLPEDGLQRCCLGRFHGSVAGG